MKRWISSSLRNIIIDGTTSRPPTMIELVSLPISYEPDSSVLVDQNVRNPRKISKNWSVLLKLTRSSSLRKKSVRSTPSEPRERSNWSSKAPTSKILKIHVRFSEIHVRFPFPPTRPETYPKHSSQLLLSSENEPFKEGHKNQEIWKKKLWRSRYVWLLYFADRLICKRFFFSYKCL